MNTSPKLLTVALAVSDVFIKPEHKLETARVAYVASADRASTFDAEKVASQSVYASLCSIAYDTRPDHAAASGTTKEIAKLISKTLKSSAVAVAGKELSPTAGKSISTIARALALHGLDGILADFDGNSAPQFFGKSFIEQRDAREKTPEDATACLSRCAKAFYSHAGSRIASGSVDADQVRALAVACLSALGLTFDGEAMSAADFASLPQTLRREVTDALETV